MVSRQEAKLPIIGIAQLLVEPSFKGGHQKLEREVSRGMPRVGREAGQRLGQGMADGFAEKSATLEAEVNQLAGVVSKAETDLDKSRARRSSARAAESKALGDLRVAELKLSELREKAGAQASAIAAAEEKVSVSRQRATDATAAHQVALRNMSDSMANLSSSQHESARASDTLSTHMRRVNTESETTERGVGRLGDRLRSAFHGSPLAGMVASIRNDSTRINVDLHQMANNVASSGTRGGRAFTTGFMVVVGGLSAVTPAAGAAGAALLGASGNVLTLAASLGKLGGVAALVPASLMAIGGGVGVMAAAFSGVGDALKAVTDEQDAFVANPRIAAMAVEDAMRSITVAEENAARAQESAARRVSDAKRSLQDTIAAVAEAEKSAAKAIEQAVRRVVDAKQSLKDAIESAAEAEISSAEAIESAARRVRDAKISLQDTIERVAEAQKSAAKAVETAQRREADATRNLVDAQKALIDVRAKAADKAAEASRKLSEADDHAINTADAYRRAVADFNKAKDDPTVSKRQMELLEANMQRTLANDKAAKQSVSELSKEQKTAAKENADAILSAEQKIADAKQAEKDALQARKDAEAKVIKQAADGAKQIQRAQEAVTDALKAQQKAHANVSKSAEASARRIADAQRGVTDAVDAERDSRAALAKAGVEGARRIADAQRAVSDATADAKRSQIDSARAIADAHRGLERVQMQQADAAARAGDASKQALDDLTPSAREAVRALLTVKDQLGGIRRIAQENFFKGFASPLLSLADTVMPQLAIGVGSIATALGSGAQDTMKSLEKAFGGNVLTGLLNGIADSITIMNRAIDPLVQSFVTLGVVGMDYMPRFAQAIADMASGFNDFIQASAASGQLDVWIEQGIQGFKDLGSIVGSVSGIFGSLTKAAEAGGAVSTLGGLAQGLRDINAAMQGETFQTTMSTIFAGAEAGSQGLLGALTKLNEAFVVGAPAFADFLRLGGEIAGTFVGGIFTALSNPKFGAGLTSFLEHVQIGVEDMVPLLPGLTSAFGSFLEALGPIVENLGPSLVKVFTGFGESIAFVIRVFDPLLSLMADSPVFLGILIGSFMATKAASAALTAAGNVQKIMMAGWRVITLLGAAAAGAFSFAQGVATVIMGNNSRALVGNKIALMGYRVATIAGTVAMKLATGAQKLLNAAFRANPFMFVVTLIVALVAAIVGLYKNNETARRIIDGAWNGIKLAVKVAWEGFIKPAIDSINKAFTSLGTVLDFVWNKKVKPVLQILGNFVRDHVADKFQKGIDTVKKIWDTLESISKSPVKFMVETVINKGLVGAFNAAVGWIPGISKLDPVPLPKGFAGGGWTGPGSKYQEAGIVHADEFVVKKSSRRRIERKAPGFLDRLNNLGDKALGYFNGGLVKPIKNGRITSGFGVGRGGYTHMGTDFAVPVGTPIYAAADGVVQNAGWNAVGGRTGIGELLSHAGGRNTYYGHLSQLLVKVGDMVKAGQRIALSGNTGRSTGPHLHFETWAGGKPVNAMPYLNGATLPEGAEGGGGGGFNPLQAMLDVGGKIGGWLGDKFPGGGMFVDAAKGLGSSMFTGMKDWLASKLAAIGDVGQDTWGNVKDFFNGKDSDVQAQVRGVANEYGWGSGRHWDSLSKIISKESSWDPNAQNKTSSAYGLFQFLNGTWAGAGGYKTSDPALQAKFGMKYIKDRYGDPEKAWAFHRKNNWYAEGGLVGGHPILHDNGGVLNPGLSTILNASGKPEAILSNRQWSDISKLASQNAQMSFPESLILNVEGQQFKAYVERTTDGVLTRHRRNADQFERQRVGVRN